MDTPGALDTIAFRVQDRSVDLGGGLRPEVELRFIVSGGNRHLYLLTVNMDGSTTTIDVVVATDGLEHTVQGVIDGTTRELWMDGVLLGSATAPAACSTAANWCLVSEQRHNLASAPHISKVQVSNCEADFPS